MPLPTDVLNTFSSEELKTDETINRFNSVEDLANSYKEIRNLQGSSFRTPGPDASAEAWTKYANQIISAGEHNPPGSQVMFKPDFENPEQTNEFWQSAGRPADFSKYVMPEGVVLPEGVEAEIREMSFAANNTQAQFSKQVTGMAERYAKTLETNTEQSTAAIAALKAKWGTTYEARVADAQKMNEDLYGSRDFSTLSTVDVEGLYATHERLTGKGPQGPAQIEAVSRGITPEEAKEQGIEIMDRLMDTNNPLPKMESDRLAAKLINLKKKYDPKFATA